MPGDRIQNAQGSLGTVNAVHKGPAANPSPQRITVKWDEGIIEIDYEQTAHFTLVSRVSSQGKKRETVGSS